MASVMTENYRENLMASSILVITFPCGIIILLTAAAKMPSVRGKSLES